MKNIRSVIFPFACDAIVVAEHISVLWVLAEEPHLS